jgi:predicted nuclease of predicted toxin-antitoxin system
VRFLLDNCLSPSLAAGLREAGHDATHVRDLGLGKADDPTVLALALAEGRVLVSADTDFGTLLARSRDAAPSVILFRRETGRRPAEQLRLLLDNLDQLAEALDAGCIVVLTDRLIRIRQLPLLP